MAISTNFTNGTQRIRTVTVQLELHYHTEGGNFGPINIALVPATLLQTPKFKNADFTHGFLSSFNKYIKH